jgi:DnaJ domain
LLLVRLLGELQKVYGPGATAGRVVLVKILPILPEVSLERTRMKLTSKHFDSLRSKPGAKPEPEVKGCQWKGCGKAGNHRAPMGRGNEGKYYLFCEEHVRQYNASYNYFDGMSDKDVATFQKDALTGHRPTWKAGANAWSHGTSTGGTSADPAFEAAKTERNDPGNFAKWRAKRTTAPDEEPRRYVRPLERKALDTMSLDETANREDIKARFKELVKRHHPDANGGDKSSEDRLREIIQAYNQLKSAGLV